MGFKKGYSRGHQSVDPEKGIMADATPKIPSLSHRRQRTRKATAAVLILLLPVTLLMWPLTHRRHYFPPSKSQVSGGSTSIEGRVRAILSHTPLIDGHVDLPVRLRAVYNNHIYHDNFTVPFEEGGMNGAVDLPRLKEGGSGGFFWSVFAPCPAKGDDFSDENYASSVQFTLQQIDLSHRLRSAYPDRFSESVDSEQALADFQKGRLISPLGIEGLHQIGNSVANLRRFHSMGVLYATLTHNCHNRFADAAILENPLRKAEPKWGGVSQEGRRLIREMNRMGMIVDISHASEDTMRDVLAGRGDWEGSDAPVIFSHSSAYSICPHPRNVKDDVLKLIPLRKSLVMVNFYEPFIACAESDNENGLPVTVPENATLHQVVKHIVYIGNLIGFDYVGIGSDFDGIPKGPEGLEDVSKYPDLIAELLRQGVSDSDAAKVVGGNILRVWKDAEKVARRMQADGITPMEDDLPNIFSESLHLGA